MDILAQCFHKNPNMVFRKIADEYILVPIQHDVTDLDAIYELGGIGAFIWELVDGVCDGYQMLAQITERYAVTPEAAQADLVEYLEQLVSINAIVPVES